MVTIRLARGGTRGRPFYHVVVCDSRRARGGRYIERVGFFNPLAGSAEDKIKIDVGRVEHWVKTGAQLSARVNNLLKTQGVQSGEAKAA
jgi:small subunit ribosomal protein S16